MNNIEALRLADELLDGMSDEHWNQLNADAAAELRRLNALNAELVEALRRCCDMVGHPDNIALIDAVLAKVDK